MYQVIGVESSPYTAKVRAVLRYRRLPYTWLCRFPQLHEPLGEKRPTLMPAVRFPSGELRVDSTTIILDLEKLHAERSVRPPDPALAFYDLLIEDMADEWLTKILYFFRFGNSADRRFASMWVMDDSYPNLTAEELSRKALEFVERQEARRTIVGISEKNDPVLEASFRRLLEVFSPAMDSFLFGSRPSLADFGMFAQLHTLSSDPTPSARIRATAPRIEYWVRRMHDLSGVEGNWQTSDSVTESVLALLRIVGDTYLPLLQANRDAHHQGAESCNVSLNGLPFSQRTFRYHVKCFDALRAAYAALSPSDQARAAPVLDETGCLPFLASPR